MFFTTHAVDEVFGPVFTYEFENAVISYYFDAASYKGSITARFKNGMVKSYGDPTNEDWSRKITASMEAVRGNGSISCGPEAALSHTLCINAMQKSMPKINVFPEDIIKVRMNDSTKAATTYIYGLGGIFMDCYDSWLLPSEKGTP